VTEALAPPISVVYLAKARQGTTRGVGWSGHSGGKRQRVYGPGTEQNIELTTTLLLIRTSPFIRGVIVALVIGASSLLLTVYAV